MLTWNSYPDIPTYTWTVNPNTENYYNIENYYIVGRTFKGGRYYSENMTCENALAEIPKYVSVIDYFGGGTVELVKNESVIYRKVVN